MNTEAGGRTPEAGRAVHRFGDLEVWKEAMRLAVAMHEALAGTRDFSLRDQMRRAAPSIAANIAEGYDRQGNRELLHFLGFARGSCAEVRTFIYFCRKTGLLAAEPAEAMLESTRRISAMLSRLMTTRRTRFGDRPPASSLPPPHSP